VCRIEKESEDEEEEEEEEEEESCWERPSDVAGSAVKYKHQHTECNLCDVAEAFSLFHPLIAGYCITHKMFSIHGLPLSTTCSLSLQTNIFIQIARHSFQETMAPLWEPDRKQLPFS